jgi:hypothetical protein
VNDVQKVTVIVWAASAAWLMLAVVRVLPRRKWWIVLPILAYAAWQVTIALILHLSSAYGLAFVASALMLATLVTTRGDPRRFLDPIRFAPGGMQRRGMTSHERRRFAVIITITIVAAIVGAFFVHSDFPANP